MDRLRLHRQARLPPRRHHAFSAAFFASRPRSAYETPSAQSFGVEITDPDGKPAYNKTLASNSNGIIHDEFSLRAAPLSATTTFRSASAKASWAATSRSRNTRSPNTKSASRLLSRACSKANPSRPRSMPATISASRSRRQSQILHSTALAYWFPFWYGSDEEGADTEGGGPNAFDDEAGEQIAQEEGSLDADGKLTVAIPTTVSANKIDYRYRVEAGVTDAAGREISGTGWIVATYGNFTINVQPSRYFFTPSSTATFQDHARDYDNKPIATSAHVELAPFNYQARSVSRPVSQADATTGADGATNVDLHIPAQGGSLSRPGQRARRPEPTIQTPTTSGFRAKGRDCMAASSTASDHPRQENVPPGDTAKISASSRAAPTRRYSQASKAAISAPGNDSLAGRHCRVRLHRHRRRRARLLRQCELSARRRNESRRKAH